MANMAMELHIPVLLVTAERMHVADVNDDDDDDDYTSVGY